VSLVVVEEEHQSHPVVIVTVGVGGLAKCESCGFCRINLQTQPGVDGHSSPKKPRQKQANGSTPVKVTPQHKKRKQKPRVGEETGCLHLHTVRDFMYNAGGVTAFNCTTNEIDDGETRRILQQIVLPPRSNAPPAYDTATGAWTFESRSRKAEEHNESHHSQKHVPVELHAEEMVASFTSTWVTLPTRKSSTRRLVPALNSNPSRNIND